jgi:hypothetical protein
MSNRNKERAVTRVRLKFAIFPEHVQGKWLWLKQFWVWERWEFSHYDVIGRGVCSWYELRRAEGFDEL